MNRLCAIGAVLWTAVCSSATLGQTTWYVDVDAPGGVGTSWAEAFADLHDALGVAQAGDQVWIAAGVYRPDPAGVDESATFVVPSGVALYGGFVGNEALLSERDPGVHITSLSGDLDGDDVDTGVFGNINQPNSDHVVTMVGVDSTTRLDGLEIVRAHGFPNAFPLNRGAGLNIISGSPTIVDCRFFRDYSDQGGAVNVGDGAPVFENCVFEANVGFGLAGYGGAVYIGGSSSATFHGCVFSGNRGVGNLTHAYGGALFSEPGADIVVDRCQFLSNSALNRTGAGSAQGRGGAIYCQGDTTITNSIFTGNTSNIGGAIQSMAPAGSTAILNCTFKDNDGIASIVGGQERAGAAGAIVGGAEVAIIGSVIYGGFADNYGGAWVQAGAKVSGSIFWNNTDSNGSIGRSNIRASGDVEFCCVENMLIGEPGEDPPDPAKFPGSISADPMFVNAALADFRLQAGSPCIDAADNTAYPAGVITDLDGNARFIDDPGTPDTGVGPAPIADIGAFEFEELPLNTCSADINGDGVVDIVDFGFFGAAFNSMASDGNYNPALDFNSDGNVDIVDFGVFGDQFNRTDCLE